MSSLNQLFDMLDVDIQAFQKVLLGICIESKNDKILPEHFLAAFVLLKDSFFYRKIRQQNLNPENVLQVLQQTVEHPTNKLPMITSFDGARLSDGVQKILSQINDWQLQQKQARKINDRVLLGLLKTVIDEETIDSLADFARLNWDEIIKQTKWPPSSFVIEIWGDNSDQSIIEEAFDRSGRKLLNALRAETEGMGLRQYTTEAIFIALLNFEPSLLDMAISTQLTSKKSYISNSKDLSLELRNRMRKPKTIEEIKPISKISCEERLINIFDYATELAENDGREKISVRDIAESLSLKEVNNRLGKLLKSFNIDLINVTDFLQSYSEEIEAEQPLVPITALERTIKEQIIGQDHAVRRILPLIKRLRFGYRRPGKPAGVFLFMGPSGTGKTQMAKALAEILYGSKDNLLMLEMGQFGTKESKSMFIGAAPGYVGYGEGKLTNGLRDNPECVILFDEVEKADPLVLDVLLRFLDEGKIDDPAGPVRDGSKCLIIITSNFFADQLKTFQIRIEKDNLAEDENLYKELRTQLLNVGETTSGDEKVRKFFRPEFIFRIDEIILFRSFNEDDFKKIAEIGINNEKEYIKKNYDYDIVYAEKAEDEILKKIAEESVNRRNEGARVINRLINVYVVNPIIDYLTAHSNEEITDLELSYDDDSKQVVVRKKS